jgi:hypothetical protein
MISWHGNYELWQILEIEEVCITISCLYGHLSCFDIPPVLNFSHFYAPLMGVV